MLYLNAGNIQGQPTVSSQEKSRLVTAVLSGLSSDVNVMAKLERRSPTRIRLPLWALLGLALVTLVLIISGGVWLFHTVQNIASDWEVTKPDFTVQAGENRVESANNPTIIDLADTSQPAFYSEEDIAPWSGTDRVTLLVLGIDQRCDETGPTRTDSMMVLTVDPVGLSAAALSLPRDLWVEIPGFNVDRINRAYYLGEVYEYPGGGEALAVETVEATLGINIDYFASINFDGFITAVDLVDGIELDVPETIKDDNYPDACYGYDPFYIEAGVQVLDGAAALKYARTRVTEGGDVDRAGRQQQVLVAVRDKVLQVNMIPQLLARAPMLWQTFQATVHTNMALEEALQLALLVQKIPRDNINTAVIDYNYVYPETTPQGEQVLIPIRDNIRALRDQLFKPPAIPTPVIQDLPALALRENARILISNGTPTFGLAASTEAYLKKYNLNVVEIDNADASTYRSTQVIDYGSHTYTTLYLTQLMSLPPLNVSVGTEAPEDDGYDVMIILGNDWKLPAE